jgi:hypothetical protein
VLVTSKAIRKVSGPADLGRSTLIAFAQGCSYRKRIEEWLGSDDGPEDLQSLKIDRSRGENDIAELFICSSWARWALFRHMRPELDIPKRLPTLSVTAACVMAAVALAVAIGIGRFAFTPLLPLMVRDGSLAQRAGAWLAASNYLGYLAGALTASRLGLLLASRSVMGCSASATFWPRSCLLSHAR